MLKGTTECYFAIFTFAGSSGIDDAMLAMARGGMTIKGVLDRGQAAHDWAAPKWLKDENIELYVPKKEGAPSRASGRSTTSRWSSTSLIVVAGSFNYTEPANAYNDENIFVMGSTHAEVAGVDVEANPCRVLARQFKREVERIIALSEPYDPAA